MKTKSTLLPTPTYIHYIQEVLHEVQLPYSLPDFRLLSLRVLGIGKNLMLVIPAWSGKTNVIYLGTHLMWKDLKISDAQLFKIHVVHCGQKQITRRKRPKIHKCTECAETFGTCGHKTATRNNFMKHLRKYDKNYSPGSKCEYCSYKPKDRWHLDKHMLSRVQSSKCAFRKRLMGNLMTPVLYG